MVNKNVNGTQKTKWVPSSIGEIADYINGRAFKPSEWEKNGLPIIRIQNLNKGSTIYNCSSKKFENKYLVKNGELLFAWSASLGAYIWEGQDAWLNQHIFKVKPKSGIDKKFLYYLLTNITTKLYTKTHGSGMVHITKNKFEDTKVTIPPFNEQKRIIAKIEELFSKLDKGNENLKTASEQLSVYRETVLKNKFSKFEYNSTVGDLFNFTGGGTPSKKESSYWNGNLPWASVKDMKGNHLLHTIDSITDKGLQNSSANLANPNDVILITRISPGKTVISSIKTAINQDLKIINPIIEAEPLFIHYLFKSLKKEVIKLSSGTTVLGINLNNLRSIPVPFLSITEQQKIVAEIESRFSVIDKIEQEIETNLQKLEVLRQSILKKAFSGKLVKQDPTDEPASILLDRIKSEKKARQFKSLL
ncbi:MAG: restriction endonuclease subunit S [Rickettsiaceae bacterium]|nr:restriction endonuclease subunit S [Rickettsiaceae bacterium]